MAFVDLLTNQWVILGVILWQLPWKGLALWRSARKKDKVWFIIFLVVNLLAIPEIVYLIKTKSKKKDYIELKA